MNRITTKHLEGLVQYLNKITNNPESYMTYHKDGTRTINIGHYHLSQAYGGNELVQTMNNSGGIHVVSTGGYTTKRDLYNQLTLFIKGIELTKQTNEVQS